MEPSTHELIQGGFLFALIGLLVFWIARRCGYFHLNEDLPHTPLRFPLLGALFYIILTLFTARFAFHLLPDEMRNSLKEHTPLLLTLAQLLTSAAVIIFLLFFSVIQSKGTLKAIWGLRATFWRDILLGLVTYLIALPWMLSLGLFAELFTYLVFGVYEMEQTAILYLRAAANSSQLLTLAVFLIVFFAPFIEEVVYRGFLQTYLKGKFGSKLAILISSLIFALVHYGPSLGAGNIPILVHLFVFALFLGFIYERQRSLLAPIALHMTFNSISVIRILVFEI